LDKPGTLYDIKRSIFADIELSSDLPIRLPGGDERLDLWCELICLDSLSGLTPEEKLRAPEQPQLGYWGATDQLWNAFHNSSPTPMNDGVEAFRSQLQKELGLSIGPKDPLLALWVSQRELLEQNAEGWSKR
jgi:hypothetical protein